MNTSRILRALANGINPETGELLGRSSAAQAPETIRLLFALSEEFRVAPEKGKKEKKLTEQERQQKNIALGKPAKSYLPWSEEEKRQLEADFTAGVAVETISLEMGRSQRAVAMQLEKAGLITAEELIGYGY